MNIGKGIKTLRKERGLSQIELADKAGITQAALSQIENGKRPGNETIKKISETLGVPESLVYVMGIEREDVMPNKQILYDQLFPVIKSMVLSLGTES